IHTVQGRIYGIAIRMLGHPQDAQDAMQEILLKIVTHLSSFRGDSSFTTWAYRIAVNHLLTMRKRRAELNSVSFEELAEQIDMGLTIAGAAQATDADQSLLVEEMKIECTQGMLLRLDREQRVAYILGEIFEVSSQEGAFILEITSEAFRQRLTRARKALRTFMQGTCGLVNPANPCRCERQVCAALKMGKLKPQHLPFTQHPASPSPTISTHAARQELKTLDRMAAVFRSHPSYAAPDVFVAEIKKLLASRQFHLLADDALKN
ncbi:MAG TPA: RNA polymerase sigma factor, partial [Ktedonobacteraceae bacterium]|nr:RNA polymerase sigma factor [Ktedonobacteraceae bacterium]